ncbi:hypothetical protein Dshi_2245 [Dinoroseobacter shibae DFL 12 = DSM 16493]|jgi:hypothetical protein|uniref:Uncharacterized protein n=1 Tax=Dinoroseobacter shibae (strain DSM 16493 / NCIMB 14021 / DFL 12) TaxID=398580 RepID=A8LR58_DINSH|nr:hypothetical protein [Dinoroseobacter shibae]ABV93981.1 hypothetical protein Dshi_2245 [Dinoroseobacter shibae DFL 12 = DSM 16493]URF45426.1 hypothetical protein M8008_11595 [Dinoroseobacter shibae]URF49731.1 hypothetical protein M8007_11595 [Dinoroseobacter shibae]
MPELIKLYIRQCFIGFGISILFVGMLYAFDIANLWSLVSTSQDGVLVTAMLVISNAVVFCGVQFAIAVMRMAEPHDDKRDGGTPARPHPRLQASTIPVVRRPDGHGTRPTERIAF